MKNDCVRQGEASTKFIILTFFTEGSPYDNGTDQVEIEKEFREIVKKHADVYLAFNPRKLIAMNPEFGKYCKDYTPWLEQHPDRQQLGAYGRSWAKLGFIMWKPHLILRVLNSTEIKEGDIVLYHDVNFRRYPGYIVGCEKWRDLSTQILKKLKCDIFMPCGVPFKKDVKAYLIRKYLGENYFEQIGLWAGLVVMRKSKILMQFLNEWADMSSQLDNVSPLPNPNPHSEFIWHSQEQSVAGVLAEIWRSRGQLPKCWPRYGVIGRNFSKKNVYTAINSKGKISALKYLMDVFSKVRRKIKNWHSKKP